jgi:diguanylate cyclase (GGDEF)-like protein/PAS domain S-box-containing protein
MVVITGFSSLVEIVDVIANVIVWIGGPTSSVCAQGLIEAGTYLRHDAVTAHALVTIGAVVLLATLAVVAHRSIVRLRRLPGAAATPTDGAFAEPSQTVGMDVRWTLARPSAVEITSGDELRELGAVLGAMAAQMQTKAREQRQIRDMIAAERDLADSVLKVAGGRILVIVLDQAGRIVQFNRACQSTTGYRSAEVEGKRVSELFLPPEEIEFAAPAFGERAVSAPELTPPRSFVCTWIARDGMRRHIAWSNASTIDMATGSTYVIATGLDITDRKTAEAELREAQERFRLAFDNAPIGMCLVSLDGRFVQVNRTLVEMLDRSENDLLDLSVIEVVHPSDVTATLRTIANMRRGQTYASQDDIRYLHANGRVVWARVCTSVIRRDNGEPLYCLTQVQDVTARRAAEERVAQQTFHDPLTDLPNRASLIEQLQLELNRGRRRNSLTGLLYADLDGFKIINDSLGHNVGDEVLREVARRLQSGIHSSDTVARFGSDEFAILCRDVPNQHYLVDMAKRLADSVSMPIVVEGRRELVVSTSIGIAFGESADWDADRLVRNANVALYQAKAGGRNGCRLFDESLSRYVVDRTRIEEGLQEGLRDGLFELHFQPIVELTNNHVIAAEALLRLNHPKLGLLMPGTFIEIAEDSGLIAPIGTWVLREACRQLARWREVYNGGYEQLYVSVNVSARQVARPDLADAVAHALAESHLPPQSLALELTESALIDVDVGALRTLERIRDMGVRLGIDDFGTGYSSLLYLKRLPVSFVKIDRSFVSGLAPNPTDREIVTAVVRLAQALGLATIAEGVETLEQVAVLRDLDCDLAQGFLFGPPKTGPPDVAGPSTSLPEPRRYALARSGAWPWTSGSTRSRCSCPEKTTPAPERPAESQPPDDGPG